MYDRAATLTMLDYRYGPWLDLAGIARTDTADGLAPVLDDVDMLVAAEDNAGVSDAVWGLYARYLTLDALCGRLGALFALSTGGDTYQLQQAYAQADKERTALTDRLNGAAPGLITFGVVTTAANEIVTISAPYLSGGWAGDEYGMVP